MAKQGMKRFYPEHKKNDTMPVPEISGKAKSGKTSARPLIAGGDGKVYHTEPYNRHKDQPVLFGAVDNDLAVENLQNDFDMTAADLQDFKRQKD